MAIIGHVDYSKRSLLDALFHQSGVHRVSERVTERVFDNVQMVRTVALTLVTVLFAVGNYRISDPDSALATTIDVHNYPVAAQRR